ncbi:hypothetical protein GPY23_04915 [Photorhabdus bodei]|uniref:hypothetical protein n=1 Tax=Photorhabdus bodei TaxID=2029681 RepID=UPI0013927959|nr:hypothetical protein [Photorhabdus bodei]NDK98375.1 hypothetical protein [Photorhabdus bodei]
MIIALSTVDDCMVAHQFYHIMAGTTAGINVATKFNGINVIIISEIIPGKEINSYLYLN